MTVDVLPYDLLDDLAATEPAPLLRPTIAYESDLATIYHGRAEDLLPALPKESVDLVCTDPPYGVDWQSNRRAERFDRLDGDGADGASRETIHEVIRECVRLVRQNRHLYVFGPADVLDGQKVSEVVQLVWDKVALGSGDVTAAWAPSHEQINFTVSKYRHAGKTGTSTLPTRMRKGSVLSYARPTGRNVRHPSEKPVALIRELLESSSRQGDVVLDPFSGSGSTAVAAVLTGRRVIACDTSSRWVEMTVERVRAAERLVKQAGSL